MTKVNFLKDLVHQLSESLPSHLGTLKDDFEKNCHVILNKAFNKFDLITREEFDTQTKVLSRTRKKLEELEAHLKVLEESLKGKHRTQKHKEKEK
jgi:ubiquinone biosynthesis accessory factor UbiK